jgi:protein-tyrosine-phosphatase
MTQYIFDKRARERGIDDVQAYSAGIAASDGCKMSENALTTLKEVYDIDASDFKSTRIRREMSFEYDYFFCMTVLHKLLLGELFASSFEVTDKSAGKIFCISEFFGAEISDPYGEDAEGYKNTALEIGKAADALIDKLFAKKLKKKIKRG